MTKIEREVYEKVVSKLTKKDYDGNLYINLDEYKKLYIPEKNKAKVLEILAEKNIELRNSEKIFKSNKVKSVDDMIERHNKKEFAQLLTIYQQLNYHIEVLEKELKRKPTSRELACEMGISEEKVEELMQELESYKSLFEHESIDELIGTGIAISEATGEYENDTYALLYSNELRNFILKVVEEHKASDEFADIFKYHYGFTDGINHSYEETAEKFNKSRGSVKYIIECMNHIVHGELKVNGFENYLYDIEIKSEKKYI